MRGSTLTKVLRSSVALGALALASTAHANCTTANGVVTCTGASTPQQAQTAIDATPPPSVTVVIAQGATLTSGFNSVFGPNFFFLNRPFTSAIGYTNDGIVGTPAATVDFQTNGASMSSASTFTLINRATQNGAIRAFDFGGAITGTNSGLVTGGVSLSGVGPIVFTNTGTIGNNTQFGFGPALVLNSASTLTTTDADGTRRTTTTGSAVTATIGGTIGGTVQGSTTPRAQDVQAFGVAGADVTVTGTAANISVQAGATQSSNLFTQTVSGQTRTQTSANGQAVTGGNARLAVSDAGRIASAQVFSQGGTATAVVNGAVGTDNNFGSINVSSSGANTNNRSTSTTSLNFGPPSTSSSSSSSTNVGQAATLDIGTTGRVTGSASTFSNAGPATTRVAGVVGTTGTFFSTSSNSTGMNTTNQATSSSAVDGSFTSANSSTQALSGGAALTAIATTGQVFGSASANGNGSADATNAGRIGGGLSAFSNTNFTPTQSNSQTRTVTNGTGGVRTTVDQFNQTQTFEQGGGTARVTNAVGALVEGNVQVNGVRGATIDNAGTIRQSVFVDATATRTTSTNDRRTTSTSTPAAGGGQTTTTVTETADTTVNRAIGGAATGNYSGTVGVAPTPTTNSFASISQNGTTASTATITGTVFGSFFGNAGGTNSDSASNSRSNDTFQPNQSSTRSTSNGFNSTATQVASTSTLTVGATGALLANSNGPANVNLVSAGGDARFTLDGGRVDGTVSVIGGSGFNTAQTQASSSSFTRAAPTRPFTFVPEVQQTQVNTNSFDQRAARGAATATVNSGSIGGDLFLSGTGNGAGTAAASALVNGTVTGLVSAGAFPRDSRSSNSDTSTRTGPNTVTRTSTSSSSTTPSADSGNVLVTVNGIAGGGISATAGAGSATVNLAGRAGSVTPGGVMVTAFDFASQRDSTTTTTSPFFFFSGQTTASRVTSSSTAVGGTATLNVTPSTALLSSGASSIEGDISVLGFAASVLNIDAGARLVQKSGAVFVGGNLNPRTSDSIGTFAGGVQTGSTGTSTGVLVGGPATITNAGIIGSATNSTSVTAASTSGATVRNTGTVTGTVTADARGASRTTTTTTTNATNTVPFRSVANNVFTGGGGVATVVNTGLITGNVSAIGVSGTVTNSGVVRGAATLGGGFVNYNTTVTTTNDPVTGQTITTTVAAPPATLFTQTYRLDQNGLLLGGVNVTGTTTTIDPPGTTVRTSNVNAAVNLNNGSITLGNITAQANTVANVNLNGSGFLGVAANDISTNLTPGQIVTGFVPTPSLTRFSAIDPALGVTVPLVSGSRISGVQTVTKAGDGTFVIVGAPVIAATGTTPLVNTLDVATLRVIGGELQLGLAAATPTASAVGLGGDTQFGLATTTPTTNTFGIRGNVENAASLVVGRRITDGTQMAVRGINVAVGGNFNSATTGNLVVGVNPAFTRSNPAAPFAPFGEVPAIASTPSFVRIDGNLALAGTVDVVAPMGGIYEAGRAYDLFNVGGTYANTGTVRSNIVSPFISFTLTPRSEGGRTIVSLNVARANFDTVATDRNSVAAAQALQASIAGLASGLRAGSTASQDLASIISALDTQFTAAQSAEAFRQLSSGEFYGSLAAISTTVPFGEATDGLSSGDGLSGVGLWFRPTGQFATYKANEQAGASAINLDNYGGSIGLNYATGTGGNVGVAGGYGALNVRAAGTPERAKAKTYMAGFYASQQLGNLHVSGQAVYGRSDWDASRGLPIFGRTATSSFKSTEVRASLRVAYAIDLDNRFELTPFARGEARYFRFDGFDEQGAGSIGVAVGRRSKTVFNPEVGIRLSGTPDDGGGIRPFAEGSYIFQGNPGTDRRMAFLGNSATVFSVDGVRPGDAIKAAIGVNADVGPTLLFVRGDYASGGQQQVGSVRGGALIKF